MPDFDVVGVGLNAVDTILVVPNFPAYGGKVAFRREFRSVGGQVATALVTCARLGLRAKYVGAIGDDERGRIQMASLRECGIDVEDVRERAGCPSQSAYIVVDEAAGERTIFWNRSERLAMSPGEIAQRQISCGRLLHIDGHDTPAVEHAARIARDSGIPVTVDVDTIYDGFECVLPLVDYLIGSTEFPRRWTGAEDPFDALRAIHGKYAMRLAAMTLGEYGALAYDGERFHYSPAFAVDCVDTTGAGDVFHGAFCYSVLQQMPTAEALEFCNAMAALNCTAYGARGGIATSDEAQNLISGARLSGTARREHPAISRRVQAR